MGFQRILLRFSKKGEARFLSHHDLMRLFERALRRAALPLRMTQGFNPHPKLSLPLALPLGVEADEEALEVDFEHPVTPADVLERLGAQLPKGIRPTAARVLPEGLRARVESVVYEAELPPQSEVGAADVERFLSRDEIVVERSTPSQRREIDIRPAVEAMSLDGRKLTFQLRVGPGGTPKPTEVVGALLPEQPRSSPAIRLRRRKLNLVTPAPKKRSRGAHDTRKGPLHAT